MSFRNERFNDGTLSLDNLAGKIDLGKARAVSDGGRGAEAVRDFLDLNDLRAEESREAEEQEKRQIERLNNLKEQLSKAGLNRLIPVLELVVANGMNRKLSVLRLCEIWRLNKAASRVKYYRGVRDLMTFISSNKIKGLTHVDLSE